VNPVLQQHAEILLAEKSARNKLITLDFVCKLHNIDADFQAFCSTGLAMRISNLHSCYSMYLNALDR